MMSSGVLSLTRHLAYVIISITLITTAVTGGSNEPTFDVPLVNVTVVAGQSIVLQCSIDNLGKSKVVWLDQNSFTLTLEDKRMIDDQRFSILRPYVKEWNLLINEVRRTDSGLYRCTVNTNPVRSKIVMLHVKVPPQIVIDNESSNSDVIVREGDTLRLTCNATGVPHPDVTWFRRSTHGGRHPYAVERLGSGGSAETLIVVNVSRYLGDLYECVANNGVPPAVSRQIKVIVQYRPEITLPNRRIGQKRGREVVLECIVSAVPPATHYWTRPAAVSAAGAERRSSLMDTNNAMTQSQRLIAVYRSDPPPGTRVPIVTSDKHVTEEYDEPDGFTMLRLNVRNLQTSDYGEYGCVATNALGSTEKTVTVYALTEKGYHGPVRSYSSGVTPVATVAISTSSSATVTHRMRSYHANAVERSAPSCTLQRFNPIVLRESFVAEDLNRNN